MTKDDHLVSKKSLETVSSFFRTLNEVDVVVFIDVVDIVVVVVDVVEVELDISSSEVDDSSSVKSVSTMGAAVVTSAF